VFTDKALESFEQDELNVRPFVRRLLRPVIEWPSNDGLVVGLYAPWGYGKTTVLNLLELDLASGIGDRKAIVVRFNPWFYNTPDAMLASFFGTLASATRRVPWLPTRDQRIKGLSTALEGLGEAVALATSPMPLVGTFIQRGTSNLAKLAKSGESDLRARQAVARNELTTLATRTPPVRLVVLIDDVDRAERPEVMALLKAVKLIGDLPNTTYVLAMDDQRVRELLDAEPLGERGAAFLEKIVQVPVKLPLIPRGALERLVKEALDRVAKEAGLADESLFAGTRFRFLDLYATTIGRRVRTLRDRARLANAYRFLLLSTEQPNDIDAEDALLVCFIQAFWPDVHDRMREYGDFLTATEHKWPSTRLDQNAAADRERKRVLLWNWILTGQELDASRSIETVASLEVVLERDRDLAAAHATLRRLFPLALMGGIPDESTVRVARAQNKISAPDRFERYFSLRPPSGEVPDRVVDHVVNEFLAQPGGMTHHTAREAARRLFDSVVVLRTSTGRSSFTQKLADRIQRIPSNAAGPLVAILLDNQERLDPSELLRALQRLVGIVYQSTLGLPFAGPDDEATVRASVAITPLILEIVQRLASWSDSVELAHIYVSDNSSLRFSDDQRVEIARAALQRFRDIVERRIDLFELEGTTFVVAVEHWRRFEKLSGDSAEWRREYLRSLIRGNVRRLVLYLLAFSSTDTNGRHTLVTRNPVERERAYHDDVFGAGVLEAELREAARNNSLTSFDPDGLIAEALSYFTPPNDSDSNGGALGRKN
jgi:hypothetical protein